MNYNDGLHVKAYQDIIAFDLRSSRAHSRHGPLGRVRRIVANTLVLTGARLMPETPALVGDRVLVFERQPDADGIEGKLQPAA